MRVEGLAGDAAPDDFLAELARWSSRDRVRRSAAERSRANSLQEQSAAGATWVGVMVDLAESGAEVTLSVGSGPKVTGRLVGVARDFVVVEGRGSSPVLVNSAAVTALAPRPGAAASRRPGGRRRPPLELTLAGALDALAGERAPVIVRAAGEPVAGSLLACGEDLVTVRTDNGTRPVVYVPLAAVVCVELR